MARLMITLDGSPYSEQAIPHGLARLSPGDELILLRVDESGGDVAPYLDGWAQRLRSPQLRVVTVAGSGSPVKVIVREAERHMIDLLVMCTQGGRLRLGSVVAKVARRSPCPVWLVRACPPAIILPPPAFYPQVLVPLDGSRRAERALDWAVAHLDSARSELVLVTACDGPTNKVIRSLEGYAGTLRQRGWQVGTRVVAGPPSEAILETAEDIGADLIVIASRGRTGLSRLLLGSVAERVLRQVECPVVLVPAH